MGKLFEIKPKAYTPDYKTEQPLTVWYRPMCVEEASDVLEKARAMQADRIDVGFLRGVMTRVVRLEYGKDRTEDPQDIIDTLTQDVWLAVDIVTGIAGGKVSDKDQVFTE